MSPMQPHVWTLVALFAASGCATQAISMTPTQRSFTARDYEDVYDAWTREADTFSVGTLSDVLNATATFESWEFRWAYVVRYAADHSLKTHARESMLSTSLADAKIKHRFLVTLAGRNYRESDLTGERSAWRVLLVDADGRHFTPISIERVERPTPSDKTYFPSVSPFRQTFRLAFEAKRPDGVDVIAPEDSHFILRFTGPYGAVDLRWDLSSKRAAARAAAEAR